MSVRPKTPEVQNRPRPAINQDTAFFWEGAKQDKLLIQRCKSCGTLRHPPTPGCHKCQSLDWDTQEASGKGIVHSFIVHHHPPLAGFDMPVVVVLVELEEGTRLISNLAGVDHSDIKIGDPVEVFFIDIPEGLRIPQFRPRSG